jgi:hypothetical protein
MDAQDSKTQGTTATAPDPIGEPGPLGPKGTPGATAPDLEAEREEREAADDARDLIRRAQGPKGDGKASDLDAGEQMTAVEWFLSDEPVAVEHTVQINIGTPWQERWIDWTIRAVDTEILSRIRKEADGGNRRARRERERNPEPGADLAALQDANSRIVLAGTVIPDLREVARMKITAAGEPLHPDPDVPALMLLKHRFRNKPGLIDQLSNEIMGLSGYDDEDIREHQAGKA